VRGQEVKELQMRKAVVIAALVAASVALAQPKVFDLSSSVTGSYNWGASWWTPYQWYRYSQTGLTTVFSDGLARPTYLNALLFCSQASGTSQYTAYISTSPMFTVPSDSWVYNDGSWANWREMSGGTQVGTAVAGPWPATLVSWDVDSWIQSHPSEDYHVVLDQMGDDWDACVAQLWLGPQGEVDLLEQPVPAPRNPGVSATALPNPSDGATLIRFALPKGERVSVRVYDAQGAVVRTLLADTQQSAGAHCLSWDGRDDTGSRVVPATYYYRVNAASQVVKGKIVLHG
jgi:hypothetical protein